jgi:SacI homology domain
LRIASASFLIALTEREQVAQIKGKPIYAVTGVSLIPLASQIEAQRAIDQYNKSPKKTKNQPSTESPGDVTDDEGVRSGNVTADEDAVENRSTSDDPQSPLQSKPHQESSSIAQDVIRRKGQYGRFAERWFSKKGWVSDKRRVSLSIRDKSTESGSKVNAALPSEINTEPSNRQGSNVDGAGESSLVPSLLPKLLRTTKMLFNSNSFFFSYDYDLTRRVGSETDTSSDLPLAKAVDPLVRLLEPIACPTNFASFSGIDLSQPH